MGQCLKEDTKIQGKERSVKVECKKKEQSVKVQFRQSKWIEEVDTFAN